MLHVAVDTGSGVAAAIADHMANGEGFDHHLLLSRDPTCQIGDRLERLAASVTELPAGRLAEVRCVRATCEALSPEIVHAHSSFGGAYARVALPRRWQARIVYTPHCYAFERLDVGRGVRAAFWLAEAALSFRGGQVAACSPLEASRARSLPGTQRVTYVPNIGRVPDSAWEPAPPDVVRVAAAGRITAQKAPGLFAEAAQLSRRSPRRMQWVWVGGGDPALEAILRSAGVEVTGWLDRDRALRAVAGSSLYVHTATWEGAPMTILEAVAAGVPVLARRTAAMEALQVQPLFETATDLLELIREFPAGPAITEAHRCGERLRRRHSSLAQQQALATLYGQVPIGVTGPSRPPPPLPPGGPTGGA